MGLRPHRLAAGLARALLTLAALAALASSFTVVRNTRRDEDEGWAELVGSVAVGRQARLVAVLLVAATFDVVAGALVGRATAAQGVPLPGALLAGAAVGRWGWCSRGSARWSRSSRRRRAARTG